MPAGTYREGGTELEVLASGKIVVAGTPFLAGSGHFTDLCVSNVIRMAGLSPGDGIALATWDSPGRSMNVITEGVMDELAAIFPTTFNSAGTADYQTTTTSGDELEVVATPLRGLRVSPLPRDLRRDGPDDLELMGANAGGLLVVLFH